MDKDKKKTKNAAEQLSERVDALEITLLLLVNSLRSVKSFEIEGDVYNVIGRIPENTLAMIESIIVKKN